MENEERGKKGEGSARDPRRARVLLVFSSLISGRPQVGNNVIKALRGLARKDADDVIPIHRFAVDHDPPLTLHETSASVAVRGGVVHVNLRTACTGSRPHPNCLQLVQQWLCADVYTFVPLDVQVSDLEQ